MRPFRMPFTRIGRIVSGLCATALVFSLASCGGQIDFGGDPSQFFGLIINADTSGNLLGGIRLESGESISLYGTFNPDGSIKEVEEVVLEDSDGHTSSLQFESGRPVLALLHDGSRIDITYDEVSSTRLTGTVKVFAAANGQTYEVPFDVDLGLALAQLGQLVEDLTGGAVQIDETGGATDSTAKSVAGAQSAKSTEVRQQLGLGHLLFAGILAGAGYLMLCTMAQVMDTVLASVEVTVRPVVVAVFLPIILMSEICRMAVTQPLIVIDIELQPTYLPGRSGA